MASSMMHSDGLGKKQKQDQISGAAIFAEESHIYMKVSPGGSMNWKDVVVYGNTTQTNTHL